MKRKRDEDVKEKARLDALEKARLASEEKKRVEAEETARKQAEVKADHANPKPAPSLVAPPRKQVEEKEPPQPVTAQPANVIFKRRRLVTASLGGLALLVFLIWGSATIYGNITSPTATDSVGIIEQFATQTAIARWTNTPEMNIATIEALATQSAIPQETPTPTLGIGSTMISPKDEMVMMYIPAGEFTMGEGSDKHFVSLDAFWIDQTEVTNAMYAKCVTDGKCDQPSSLTFFNNSKYADHPVMYVSWNDAKTYCSWADRGLPTEADWEKAASWDAKKQTKYIYPWGDTIDCSFTNYHDGSKYCVGTTAVVGNYPKGVSPYGALDMAGNVWEWVSDWYDSSYYSSSPSPRMWCVRLFVI